MIPERHTERPASGLPAPDTHEIVVSLRGLNLLISVPQSSGASAVVPKTRLLQLCPGIREELALQISPHPRGPLLRALPSVYRELKEVLERFATVPVRFDFDERPALPFTVSPRVTPRPYQEEAIAAWNAAGGRGVVVLPTGAGKTIVAALAIAQMSLAALVVVPTIDLLQQWQRTLHTALGVELAQIGIYGGGQKTFGPLTIITYDSATTYVRDLNRFALLIFDECHHLPAASYRTIAEATFAPFRLGLSATPERADLLHEDLDTLIGPEVYHRLPADLAKQNYIAGYREEQIEITLADADLERYSDLQRRYRQFLRTHRLIIRSPQDFQKHILWRSAWDPQARLAMLAWRESRNLALNAPAKLAKVEELLARHRDEQVLVFSEYNVLVDEISRRLCLPSITHKTPTEERRAVLERFRQGRYTKLVSGRILNEGVDLPDCSVAIIVSGNSTKREYIQRLGRILRPKARQATLYELVTADTAEESLSRRRRQPPGAATRQPVTETLTASGVSDDYGSLDDFALDPGEDDDTGLDDVSGSPAPGVADIPDVPYALDKGVED